ncbi:hypothetical protein HMPREF9153_1370 [Cutibacterium avidum ATCC 25577]|uniref:Uncharacterized protein n=1 Tax=Cutibacterium avidum ATCC 25577 TaxID=997355 RepID=G4CXW3_9ACTN|nr:hypothetical protein HMPREF9153_1370 [Cutibacterium avidum ATCC 25577]
MHTHVGACVFFAMAHTLSAGADRFDDGGVPVVFRWCSPQATGG